MKENTLFIYIIRTIFRGGRANWLEFSPWASTIPSLLRLKDEDLPVHVCLFGDWISQGESQWHGSSHISWRDELTYVGYPK